MLGMVEKPDSPEVVTIQDVNRRCSVTSLYMICRHYGMDVSYDMLCEIVKPTNVGVSMLKLKEVAESLDFSVKVVSVSPRDIVSLQIPVIVFVEPKDPKTALGHYMVVVPVESRGGFWVFDPPRQKRWVSKEEIEKADVRRVAVLWLHPKHAVATRPSMVAPISTRPSLSQATTRSAIR
jgi:ABC-type bacteriocin/lantibiotic exporter with double-glycine peptidase domain